MRHTEKIDLDRFGPAIHVCVNEGTDRSQHAGAADEHVSGSELPSHALHGRLHLLTVAHVGKDAQRASAGVFNLELGDVEFRLASRQKSHAGAGGSEAHSEAFADSTARPGDEDVLISDSSGEIGQMMIISNRECDLR
jgi:hypothetical protein